MTRVRVEVDFDMETDLWLNQDCLAKSVRFERDGYDIEIRLPPLENLDAASITMTDLSGVDGYVGSSGYVDRPSEFQAGFHKFRICIREEVEGICQTAFEGEVTKDARDLIIGHQRKCRKIAESVATDFLDQLRYRGQTWLGLIGTISYSVAPRSSTFDDETAYRFRFGHGELAVPMRSEEAALTSQALAHVRNALATSQSVPLPETFLADAQYFLVCGTHSGDFQRAVLLAAIACELKVKEVLKEKAFPGAADLVDILVSSPRDFSMSASGLFDKAMKAAVGHSLREDDKGLYKAIANNSQGDALFQQRNAIAHSGAPVTREVAQKNVRAARKVFTWLDALQPLQSLPDSKRD